MREDSQGREWVTMKDVAKQAGVSTMTVSRSFSDPAQVTVTARERVLETAIKLGYPQVPLHRWSRSS